MTQASQRFAAFGEADWRAAAAASLNGAGLETLVSHAADSIELQPLYARRVGPRALRGEGAWRAIARLDHPDPAAANEQARDDLANGADGLQIVFAGAAGALGYGLAKFDAASLHRAFEGVRFEPATRFELDLGPEGDRQASAFAALIAHSGTAPSTLDVAFGLDPLGALARSGRAQRPWGEEAAALAKLASFLKAQGFAGPFLAADARIVHAAGGSPAQELGFALAAGLAYLRALAGAGFSPEAAADAIGFRLTADADQMFTLAKFRALRLMWGRAREACGLGAAPARLHAETAWRAMSARSPYVNVMRGAGAAFAAALGGADSICVLPFTQSIGLPDAQARRLARNTQLILDEEAHLGFVADPAAGAGVYEALTAELCEKGWVAMQALERAGGLAAALREGGFQRAVAAEAARLAGDAARLQTLQTGVSAHADLAERGGDVLPASPPAFAFAGERVAQALQPMRIAAPFEALRDASDAVLAREGARPKVFLAAIGTRAAHSRRIAFARDLFEVGGLETIVDVGPDDPAELGARLTASGATLACLCIEEDDAARARDLARVLKAAGARWLVLAGKPGAQDAAWRQAGIDDFISAGADALGPLQRIWAQLAATP